MTQTARIVLQDVKYAIKYHDDTLQSEAFRVSWFTIVGLLRSVGYVLKNVDSQSSLTMKKAIEQKWADLKKSRPEPKIFWEFIETERNRFLKNYEHGISRLITVPAEKNKFLITIDCGNSSGGIFSQGTKLKSCISSGPYKGCYEKDVAWQAHDWWKAYLDEVDKLERAIAGH